MSIVPTTYQKIASTMLQASSSRKMTADEAADFVTQECVDDIDAIIHARPLINVAVVAIVDGVLARCTDPKTCDEIYDQREHLVYLLQNRVYHGMTDSHLDALAETISDQMEPLYAPNRYSAPAQSELCIEGAAQAHKRWASRHVEEFLDADRDDQFRHLPFWMIGELAAQEFWAVSQCILHDIGCACDPVGIQNAYENYAANKAGCCIRSLENYPALSADEILLAFVRAGASYASTTSPRGQNRKVNELLENREFIFDTIFPQLEKAGFGLTMTIRAIESLR